MDRRTHIIAPPISESWAVGHLVAATAPDRGFWVATLLSQSNAFLWNAQWWELDAQQPLAYIKGSKGELSDDAIICSLQSHAPPGSTMSLHHRLPWLVHKSAKGTERSAIVEQMHRAAGLRPSTQTRYARYWETYRTFCKRAGEDPYHYSEKN